MEKLILSKELLAPFATKGKEFALLSESESYLFHGVVEKITAVQRLETFWYTLVVAEFKKLIPSKTLWCWRQIQPYEIEIDSRLCLFERRGSSLSVSRLNYRDSIVFFE